MKSSPGRRSKKPRKAFSPPNHASSPTPRKCFCKPPEALSRNSARVLINDAAERLEHETKRAIAAIHEGDMLTTQMAVLKRFAKRAPVDTIALRRKVAAAVQSQDRYPLEGR